MSKKITTENILEAHRKNPRQIFKSFELSNVDFCLLCRRKSLPLSFIEKYILYIDMPTCTKFQILSESFLNKHQHKFCHYSWINISRYQKLSEKFMEDNFDNLSKKFLCIYQKLSEKLMLKILGIDNYGFDYDSMIAKYQKLSGKFIWNNIGFFSRTDICKYQKLSSELCKKILDKYGEIDDIFAYQINSKKLRKKYNIPVNVYNTLYWSKSNFKKALETSPFKLETDDWGEYIIAFKSVTLDGHSLFNFQYKYEKGEIYKCHADPDVTEYNSFGLSAWTRNKAEEHGIESERLFKIIKVKIYISDIAAILPSHGYKIRARKFQVI